jgi:hypothetical protein
MRWVIRVLSLFASCIVAGCGSDASIPTVPTAAYSRAPLPNIEPVRGGDHEKQALEGAIARFVQWTNRHYGKSVLDTKAANGCQQQVEDLWNCSVTVSVVRPVPGWPRGPQTAHYTVTRDTENNQLIFLPGG